MEDIFEIPLYLIISTFRITSHPLHLHSSRHIFSLHISLELLYESGIVRLNDTRNSLIYSKLPALMTFILSTSICLRNETISTMKYSISVFFFSSVNPFFLLHVLYENGTQINLKNSLLTPNNGIFIRFIAKSQAIFVGKKKKNTTIRFVFCSHVLLNGINGFFYSSILYIACLSRLSLEVFPFLYCLTCFVVFFCSKKKN